MKPTPTRRRIAAALSGGPPCRLGLSIFAAGDVDGVPILRESNWHGASSVIPSWHESTCTSPAALVVVIWKNRRHYRKPFPGAAFYKPMSPDTAADHATNLSRLEGTLAQACWHPSYTAQLREILEDYRARLTAV